jgi:hypothetical protein
MKEVDQLFIDLARSPFRRRFQLRSQELRYLEREGLACRFRRCVPIHI